jgi:hypothetical protein
MQLDNAGISVLSCFGGRFSLTLLNDIGYLAEAQGFSQ